MPAQSTAGGGVAHRDRKRRALTASGRGEIFDSDRRSMQVFASGSSCLSLWSPNLVPRRYYPALLHFVSEIFADGIGDCIRLNVIHRRWWRFCLSTWLLPRVTPVTYRKGFFLHDSGFRSVSLSCMWRGLGG